MFSRTHHYTSLCPRERHMHLVPSLLYLACLVLLCIPLRALSASSQTQQDLDTILQRKLGFITASATTVSQIASWHVSALCVSHTSDPQYSRLQTLGPGGSWPAAEIDYTAGCPAQRANWPASTHWSRVCTYLSRRIHFQLLTYIQ